MDYVLKALTGKWPIEAWYKLQTNHRTYYRLKAAICLLINREPSRRDEYDLWTYSVIVTYTDGGVSKHGGYEPDSYWCEAILVGRGVLSNWWACVAQTSS